VEPRSADTGGAGRIRAAVGVRRWVDAGRCRDCHVRSALARSAGACRGARPDRTAGGQVADPSHPAQWGRAVLHARGDP
jgi:hypothetical protein